MEELPGGGGTLTETGHRGLAPGTHGNVTPQGRDDALGRKSRKDCDLLLLAYCPLAMNSRRSLMNPQQTPLDISLAANDETEWIVLFSKFLQSFAFSWTARLGCGQPDKMPDHRAEKWPFPVGWQCR